MKRILLVTAFIISSWMSKGQELGIRFGEVVGGNVAVDGVFSLGEFSRVHADVSFGDGLGIEGLWDFFYKPIPGASGLNWYIGAGPSMFIHDDLFLLGAAGEIGLEYRFAEVPIALGLDWRPVFWIVEDTDFSARGFGFNIRYVFGGTK